MFDLQTNQKNRNIIGKSAENAKKIEKSQGLPSGIIH
jgi:hypothetical protein